MRLPAQLPALVAGMRLVSDVEQEAPVLAAIAAFPQRDTVHAVLLEGQQQASLVFGRAMRHTRDAHITRAVRQMRADHRIMAVLCIGSGGKRSEHAEGQHGTTELQATHAQIPVSHLEQTHQKNWRDTACHYRARQVGETYILKRTPRPTVLSW
jgi:hypothetical protein